MAGRRKRLSDDDKRVIYFSLGRREHMLLQLMTSGSKTGETATEIVAAAIRHYFHTVVPIPKEELLELIYGQPPEPVIEHKTGGKELKFPKKEVG